MRSPKFLLALLATLALAACATPGKYDDLSPQRYINRAASADTFEVMAGQLALQRSADPDIRSYAQVMINEHTLSSQMLMAALAGRKDQTVAVPVPGLMLPEQRDALARLQASTMFDRDYVNALVMAHDDAIELHRTFAEQSNNDLLVNYARTVLPHVQAHRDAIGMIAKRTMAPAAPMQPGMMQPAPMQPMQPVIVQ